MTKISTGYQYTVFQRRVEELNKTRLEHGRAAVGMGDAEAKDVAHLHVYQSMKAQLTSLNDACTKAQDRSRKTTQALDTVHGVATRLAELTHGRRSGQFKTTYATECRQLLQNLERDLNVRSTNGYIFAGRATNVPPMDTQSMDPVDVDTVDFGYYKGSANNFNTIINLDGQMQEFEIRADDAGIERLVRALRAGMTVTNDVADDDPRIEKIYTLTYERCIREDLPRLLERAANIEKNFDQVSESIETTKTDLDRLIAMIRKTDMSGISQSIQLQQESDLLLKLTYANAQKLLNDSDLFRAMGL